MDFRGIFHNKLFLIGGGFVALIALVMLLRGSSNGVVSTTTGVAPPTDAQVASQTSLALAQIDSASRASETNASLAAAQLKYQSDITEKGMDAALAKYSIDASTALQGRQIDAQLVSDERSQNLQASIAKWTLDQATFLQTSNNNFQLAYAQQANASADHQAEIVAAVTRASIDANTALGVASLQAQTAQVASYVGAQVSINDSNNAKDIGVAKIQSSTTKHGQTTGLIGGIIGGALSIFSDRSLKGDIRFVGIEPRDGLPRYSYRLHGDTSYQVGVMADEVPRRAKGRKVRGKETVNYLALA